MNLSLCLMYLYVRSVNIITYAKKWNLLTFKQLILVICFTQACQFDLYFSIFRY